LCLECPLPQDLEELREELDDDEYDEVRADTMEQLEELREQMDKFTKGNMTLVSALGAMRLAVEVRRPLLYRLRGALAEASDRTVPTPGPHARRPRSSRKPAPRRSSGCLPPSRRRR